MESGQVLALVLRSIRYQERHRIVTALTSEYGLVSAIAKNSIQSRRYGGALEPITLSDFNYKEKPTAELLLLLDAVAKESFNAIRGNFCNLSIASVLCDLLLRVAPKGEPCPDLMKLTYHSFSALSQSTLTTSGETGDLRILNIFLAKLLQWSGVQPQVQSCSECALELSKVSQDSEVSFRLESASWICPSCRQKGVSHFEKTGRENSHGIDLENRLRRIQSGYLYQLMIMMSQPLKKSLELIPEIVREQQKLFQLLEALVIFHVPGLDRLEQSSIKALKFLDLESNLKPVLNDQKPTQESLSAR